MTNMIERLIDAQEKAEHAEPSWDARVVAAAGVRAILSSLASMGVERVGRTEEETGVRVESAIETAYACNGCGLFASEPDDPCAQCDVPRLEAIIASLGKERDEARASVEWHKQQAIAAIVELDCAGMTLEEAVRAAVKRHVSLKADQDEMRARAERAEAMLAVLSAAARTALGEFRDAIPYVPDYFRKKYDYDASANAFETAIAEASDPLIEAISRAPVATLSADEQAEFDRLAKEAQMWPGVSNKVVLFGLLKRAREEADNAASVAVQALEERDEARAECDEERKAREVDRAEIQKLDVRWRQHYRERVGLMMLLRHPDMTSEQIAREVARNSPTIELNIAENVRTFDTARELVKQQIDAALASTSRTDNGLDVGD